MVFARQLQNKEKKHGHTRKFAFSLTQQKEKDKTSASIIMQAVQQGENDNTL